MESDNQTTTGPVPVPPTPSTGDETTTPAPTAAPPVAEDPTSTDGGSTPPDKDGDGDDHRNKAQVEAANREAATYRRKLREAEEKLRAREEADLTEAERAKKRAEEAEALAQQREDELRSARVETAVTAEAAKLRFRDPRDAMAFVRPDSLTFDDDGKPTNAAEEVQRIAHERGYLIQPATSNSSTGAPASGPEREETFDEKRRRIFGGARGGSAFDNPEARGGGVIAGPTGE